MKKLLISILMIGVLMPLFPTHAGYHKGSYCSPYKKYTTYPCNELYPAGGSNSTASVQYTANPSGLLVSSFYYNGQKIVVYKQSRASYFSPPYGYLASGAQRTAKKEHVLTYYLVGSPWKFYKLVEISVSGYCEYNGYNSKFIYTDAYYKRGPFTFVKVNGWEKGTHPYDYWRKESKVYGKGTFSLNFSIPGVGSLNMSEKRVEVGLTCDANGITNEYYNEY